MNREGYQAIGSIGLQSQDTTEPTHTKSKLYPETEISCLLFSHYCYTYVSGVYYPTDSDFIISLSLCSVVKL